MSAQCVIESDVLFFGQQEYDEGNQSRREFLNKLNQLPKWDKSIAWCRGMVLRYCLDQQQIENPVATVEPRGAGEDHFFDEKPSASLSTRYEEKHKRLLLLSFKWLEKTWHRVLGMKGRLKYLIPLVLTGLLLALLLFLQSLEKSLHWSHRFKEHHDEHNDHRR